MFRTQSQDISRASMLYRNVAKVAVMSESTLNELIDHVRCQKERV